MLETGLTHTSTLVVKKENLAVTLGSGDLEVLATPAMMALMENAAMLAVKDVLPDGSTTVGSQISSTHLKPTGEGKTVTATAILTEVEGRKLTFKISASDESGVIGEGSHIRYIVDADRFMSKVKHQ